MTLYKIVKTNGEIWVKEMEVEGRNEKRRNIQFEIGNSGDGDGGRSGGGSKSQLI